MPGGNLPTEPPNGGERCDRGSHRVTGRRLGCIAFLSGKLASVANLLAERQRSLTSSESADSGFRKGERQRPAAVIARRSKVDQEFLAGSVSHNHLTSLSYCCSGAVVACGKSKVDQEDHAHAGWQPAYRASSIGKRAAASHSCPQGSLPSRTCWPSAKSLNSSESADSGFRKDERQRPAAVIARQSKVDQELLVVSLSHNHLTSLSYCCSRTVVDRGKSKVDQEDHARAGWQPAYGAVQRR